jgi:formate dehydrogenase major subunit
MALTRREFLKWSGTAGAAAAAMCLGFDLRPVKSYAAELEILKAKETTTICPYCAVGCGIIVHTKKSGKLLNTEGDPDHPINEGALCAKGAGLYQMTVNKNRRRFPLYRAPESDEWEEIEWEDAIQKIAEKIKETRDATFTEKKCQWPGGQSDHRHRPRGFCGPGQRGMLAASRHHAGTGAGLH